MAERTVPKRLYKYRSFSNLTLGMLVNDTVYYADPSTFNDPLDTSPTLNTDIGAEALEAILAQMIEARTHAEMSAAAKTIRYRGPKTLDHIARQSRVAAEWLLADIRYNATNPLYEMDNPEQFLLGQYVQEELLRRYDKGVFSLAERANCPLMWSHYGDQHRGLCLGYSVPPAATGELTAPRGFTPSWLLRRCRARCRRLRRGQHGDHWRSSDGDEAGSGCGSGGGLRENVGGWAGVDRVRRDQGRAMADYKVNSPSLIWTILPHCSTACHSRVMAGSSEKATTRDASATSAITIARGSWPRLCSTVKPATTPWPE
jgi:hypothetical protein